MVGWPATVAMGMGLNVRVRAHLLYPVLQCTVSNANDSTESKVADWKTSQGDTGMNIKNQMCPE